MTENARIYLDFNATTPLKPAVKTLMSDVLGAPANASATHSYGREARSLIETARRQLAKTVNTDPETVIFTSGATEANNMILKGCEVEHILISEIEHPAILRAAPEDATIIPVDKNGVVNLDALEKALSTDTRKKLVSIMMVNNETGIIQPVTEVAAICKKYDTLFHCDAAQAIGRIPVDMQAIGMDALSIASHKIGGPQGAGALIVCKGVEVCPLLQGGLQEQRKRAGTENVAAIAGFGKACELALTDMDDYARLEKLRNSLETRIQAIAPEVVIFDKDAPRVGNTTVVALPGLAAQTQLMALDLDGIAVSSGSACSSGSFKPSHVLKAMGASDEQAMGALRISLGWTNTPEDIDKFIESWKSLYERSKERAA